MKRLTVGGLILGVSLSFGLAACGGSTGNDVSDITTAAMTGGDIPSGFAVNAAGTADSFVAYKSATLTKYGNTGTTCASSSTAAVVKNNFQHGLAQSALDANGYGIVVCAIMLSSDDNASSAFADEKARIIKAPFKAVSAKQVGDDSFAVQGSAGGIHAGAYAFRHGNTIILVASITKSGNVSVDELYTIAKNINGRLK